MKTQITAADVRELAESKKMIPLMVRWHETEEIEIVAAVGFHDNSGWSEKNATHDSIANQDDLFDIAQKPLNQLTDFDCEQIAAAMNLKQRREQLNLSQSGLAQLIGVRQATISDWESGTHQIQHPKLLDLALKTLEREKQTEKSHGRRKNREAI